MVKRNDTTAYQEKRDAVILSFLPHASNTTKMTEKVWYKTAQQANEEYLETVLYGEIWGDLLPNERLAIEHLYYEKSTLVSESTRLFANLHAYISARRNGNEDVAKKYLKYALWEVLYNSPFQPRNVLERDKAKHRRKAQATMLNSLNISMMDIHTPDYVIEPIRQHYQNTPLEALLPDIVFPLEANARVIAEEVQRINANMLRDLNSQKSLVSEARTIPEATNAFAELYMGITDDGTRKLIDKELEKLARQGRNESEILEELGKVLQSHQDSTIPYKVDMLANHFHGKLSEVRMRESGESRYVWVSMDDEKVRPSHAANDGKIFSFDNPPDTGHPGHDYNCRCGAAPIQVAGSGKIVIEIIKQLLSKSSKKVGQASGKVRKNPVVRGEKAPKGGRKDTEWSFDKNKSRTRWENQKKKRGWTDEEITKAIKDGDAYPAENFRTNKPATLYEHNGKYVIRDDTTKEIIQIGGKGFEHPSLP